MRGVSLPTRLALAVAVMGLFVSASSFLRESAWQASAIEATVAGRPWANFNDPAPTLAAARRLREDPGSPLYEGVHVVGASFLYPPLAAWLYRPFIAVDDPESALLRFDQAAFVLIAIMAGSLALPAGRGIAAVVACAAIAYYPLTRAVELNQASLLVALGIGAALVAGDRGHAWLAGAPLAFAVAIKPHLVLMLPILAWRAPRTALGAVATGAGLLVLSLAVAGIDNHVIYVTSVLPALGTGYTFFPNQSWNGLLNRFVHDDMARFVLAPPSEFVRLGTLVLGVVTLGGAVAVAWRATSRRSPAFVIGFAWLAATIVSPIAWEHHYIPALFLFALWLRERVCGAIGFARWDLALALSWVAMSTFFEVRDLAGPSVLLASYLLAGALVLAALFAWALVASDRRVLR